MLVFDSNKNEVVQNLDVGDHISFECNLTQFGKRNQPHMCYLMNLDILKKGNRVKC